MLLDNVSTLNDVFLLALNGYYYSNFSSLGNLNLWTKRQVDPINTFFISLTGSAHLDNKWVLFTVSDAKWDKDFGLAILSGNCNIFKLYSKGIGGN